MDADNDNLAHVKICARCKETKPLSEFHKDSRRPDGKQARCKACSSEMYKAWRESNPTYHDKWRLANKDRIEAVDKVWRDANRARIKQNTDAWRNANAEHVKEVNKAWRDANKEKHKQASYAWRKANPDKAKEIKRRALEKKKDDPQYKLENAMRAGVYNGLMKGSKAGRKTFDLLGYTPDDLRTHLEKQFQPGMTWANYGRNGWHVDHKIPLSAHNYETPKDIDFKKAWALSNLQPLWEADNIRKHAKLSAPFQPSLPIAA